MAHNISKALIFLVSLWVCSIQATKFSCDDLDAAACKAKFAKQFEDDFKVLHLAALNKFFNTYIEKAKAVIAELPDNDAFKTALEKVVTNVSKGLEDLNANSDKPEKITEIIDRTMNHLTFDDLADETNAAEFLKIAEKNGFNKNVIAPIRQAHTDTGKLWIELYAGLKPEDIQAYPEYSKVNDLMVKLAAPEDNSDKMIYFLNAASLLNENFNIEYFKHVTDIL